MAHFLCHLGAHILEPFCSISILPKTATYNNDYTYNTTYQSWYYDNTSNTLNYTDNDTYYAFDNRQYFTSLDKGTQDAVKKCGMENA